MAAFDYNCKRWRHKSEYIKRRDKGLCQYSKRYGKRVPAEVVHHIYPADEYPEYAWCDWNLISLSKKVHNLMHDRNTGQLTVLGLQLQRRTKIPQNHQSE